MFFLFFDSREISSKSAIFFQAEQLADSDKASLQRNLPSIYAQNLD